MLVVPDGKPKQLLPERFGTERHQESSGTLDLHRLDEAFHHGNATMLAHRPKPGADPFSTSPVLEALAPELLPLVADQVLRLGLGLMHDASQEGAYGPGVGILLEHSKAHCVAGEVIDCHGNPVAEGPALGQAEGEPRDPESQVGGNQGEIDMPDVMDPLGGNHPLGSLGGNTLGLQCLFAGLGRCSLLPRRLRVRIFFEDATDRGRAQMEPGSAEHLSDLLLPPASGREPSAAGRGSERSRGTC